MCGDTRGTANFCCLYSIVGALFMLMVILMLTHQPFIMGGIEDVAHAKSNAYGALFSFIIVFLISILYLIQDSITGRSGRRQAAGSSNGSSEHSWNNNDRRRPLGESQEYQGIPLHGFHDYALNIDMSQDATASHEEGVFS